MIYRLTLVLWFCIGAAWATPSVESVEAAIKDNQYAVAEKLLQEVVVIHPTSHKAWSYLSQLQAKRGDFLASSKSYERYTQEITAYRSRIALAEAATRATVMNWFAGIAMAILLFSLSYIGYMWWRLRAKTVPVNKPLSEYPYTDEQVHQWRSSALQVIQNIKRHYGAGHPDQIHNDIREDMLDILEVLEKKALFSKDIDVSAVLNNALFKTKQLNIEGV